MSYQLAIFNDNWTDSRTLEIDASQRAVLSLSFADILANKNASRSFFSYNIPIPGTPPNLAALDHLGNINSRQGMEVAGKSLNAVMKIGLHTFRGKIKGLKTQTKNRSSITFDFQFLAGSNKFYDALPQYIRDLILGYVRKTQQSIEDASSYNVYDGSSPITYSLKYYGVPRDTIDGAYIERIPYSEIFPDVYMAAIMDAIEQYTGIRIQSDLINSEWFRHLTHPMTNDKVQHTLLEITANLDIVTNTARILNFVDDTNWTIDDQIEREPGENLIFLRRQFSTFLVLDEAKADDNKIYIEGDVTTQGSVRLRVLDADDLSVKGFVDLQTDATSSFSLLVDIGNSGGFLIELISNGGTIEQGGKIRIGFESKPIKGGTIKVSTLLNDVTTVDYMASLISTFNLITFYDQRTGSFWMAPKWGATLSTGEVIPPFYKSIAHSTDWRNIVDAPSPVVEFTGVSGIKRNLIYAFKDDSNDKLTNKLTYSRQVTLDSKYEQGQTTKENELFAATINRRLPFEVTGIDPADDRIASVPTFISFDENDEDVDRSPKYNFQMRILYKVGRIHGFWRRQDDRVFSQYDYATQLDVERGINLTYNDVDGVPGLVSTFFWKDVDLFNRGVPFTVDAAIPLNEIANLLEFIRTPKYMSTPNNGQGHFIVDTPELNLNKRELARVKLINLY